MPSPSSSLIDQLFRTVETLGVERTDTILKEAQFQGIVFPNKDVEFVITTVASAFEIPVHEIYYGAGRKNDRKWAIGFCIHYLNTQYDYSLEQIAHFINKDVSSCHKYGKMICSINAKNFAEKRYMELKELFDIRLKNPKK